MPAPPRISVPLKHGPFTLPPGRHRAGGVITVTIPAGGSVTITDPAGVVLFEATAGDSPGGPPRPATVTVNLSGHPTPAGDYTIDATAGVTGSLDFSGAADA